MALDPAACERMIAAARGNGVRLGVAYYRHHYPVVRRFRELLRSGEIGRPVIVRLEAFEPFDARPGEPRSWLLRRSESGGGPMMDFGCHRVEVLLDLLGPVERVHGLATRVQFAKREVEDTCVAEMSFRGGALAVLSVSHAAFERTDSVVVYGTQGSAQVPVLNQGRLLVTTAAGRREEELPPHANLHQPLVEDFVAAVREGRAPAVTGEVGLAVARVMAAIYA
jgi:predicted dehydrogenase